jgi:DNA-binding response OmpR family regulator
VRVLVVEDEEDLRVAVSAGLRTAALAVDSVGDIATADEALFVNEYDCVVFDRILPDGDSITYVRRRRQQNWNVPVLFLTGRDTLADRVDGFAHGGDDYLVKPFAVAELTARVLSLCRRAGVGRSPVQRYADVEVDTGRREVRRDGVLLTLTAKEFQVLEYLMLRPGRVLTRAELIDGCWDGDPPMSNAVDATIKRLRSKLGPPELIRAIRGQGYQLIDQDELR